MVPWHDIACLPLRAAYFGYLKSLTDGDVAYEQQVSFPAAPDGDEAAWDVLKDVVRGCLRVSHIAAGRYQAKTVRQKLFNLMVQRGWNNDVLAL
ncbi:hypothetical protein WJX82_001798 [Trebouxia sp. C0006]